MRVAHVVTYVSPDGSFGGPVRVALAQAEALADRGHDVTVFAAAPRELAGIRRQKGYTLSTFPAVPLAPGKGFAMMSAPRMVSSLAREIAQFDVAHIHLARDLVTIPAAIAIRRAKVPYFLQPHGMIDVSARLLARPLDACATKPLLRGASAVLVLTDQEQHDIEAVESRTVIRRISNGIRVVELPEYEGRENVVLFLARLHDRKRPVAFVEMANVVGASFEDVKFILVGPDEGAAAATLVAISASPFKDRIQWVGPVSPDETDRWISKALAYVLPAVGEVFPMTILEALQAGTPVVATDSLGIAEGCLKYGAALITDGSVKELARAVDNVLANRSVAESLRRGGLRYLSTELDITGVAERLESLYVDLGVAHGAHA